ncbi:phosphomannomutase/phosphoglucomutase [Candidatus Manganitrophus noduliformans]|uniref:Phosphomannomutase/phosphoglucomutase n=1 Tax=Candidatus Manganitrophus noduliformans TaxID=2606439 RepID=A0A7X6DPQ7_9BACT|nr:phosphomannomutase/phosphoglucomutase [Candidatus Manganitrophus noduliformans]NKE70969.1 phosphomannomutase/phosphoglucomutase [Candidatus Manganitrophus noduliformans]
MSIFREYDIRGVYGTVLTEKVAEEIGKAFATLIRRSGGKKISLGYDIRLSSPSLREALLAGLLSTGIDVVDIGACPTPVLYFSLFNLQVDGGVMITASHNPAEFNGFKLCRGKGTLFGAEIQQVRTMAESGDFDRGKGELTFERDFLSVYLNYFVKHFGSFRSKKVVVDCGNAAAALIAPRIMEKLGCEVIPLYCEPDGRFPNHHPDPTVPENIADLIECVRKERADVGIAFDGDGDRLGAVDEKGEIIWGDKLTLLFATDILKRNPGATIISEVKASQVLYDEISRLGGNGIMWKTGHSLIKSKMKETGALLAGEMSGHLFFADRYFGYDDAIYAGCRLVEILVKENRPLSSFFIDLPKTYVTPEIRVDCPDDRKFAVVEKCREYFSGKYKTVDIDGVRVLFEDGWGLIRASNTQPALVLRFEASSGIRVTEIQEYVNGLLAKLIR